MSSSCSIDEIPECIREIFNNPKAEEWFCVFYITRDKKIIAQHSFLFKGRDKTYRQRCVSAADGIFREAYIIFLGNTARYVPHEDYSLKEVEVGQHFYMSINGEIIP
jgi:hypothetical protein